MTTSSPAPFQRRHVSWSRAGAFAAVLFASTCVLPLAPDFEGEANLSPYIATSDPPIGSTLTRAVAGQELSFRVTVGDANLGDQLSYRWIFDYPGFTANTRTTQLSTIGTTLNAQPERPAITFTASCEYALADLKGQPHRLMLAVSDRGFTPNDPSNELYLTNVPKGGNLVVAMWTFYIDCTGQPGGTAP